jgi:hypothetical protein
MGIRATDARQFWPSSCRLFAHALKGCKCRRIQFCPSSCAGHSISSGAAGGVLANFFGTDEVSFTIGTEYKGLDPRDYTSFQQVGTAVVVWCDYGAINRCT